MPTTFDFDAPVDRRGSWSERWDRYGPDVIPLWIADTDFRAAPVIREALARRVEHGVYGYTRYPDELREALAARMLERYRWRIDPAWIVIVPGTIAALHLGVRYLVAADGHVLLPRPIYPRFDRAVELAPRAHDHVPLVLERGRWVLDEDAMRRQVRPATRLFMLCNPQNPGGTVFTAEELLRVAAFAEEHDLVILSDEIHAELVLEVTKTHVPIASLDPAISRRTVTLVSPNKAFNFPGSGCAFAIIEDPALRRAFSVDNHATVPDVGVFGLTAALAAYHGADTWLAAQIAYLRGNLGRLESAVAVMPGLSMAHVEATYLAWIDTRALGRVDAFDLFLKKGVALSPGKDFGTPGFVRLNFGTQRRILDEALARMRDALPGP